MGIARDQDMPGYEAFEKEAWGFKVRVPSDCMYARFLVLTALQHDRLNVERRLSNVGQSTEALGSPLGEIKTSDIARLMELFQVSPSPLPLHCMITSSPRP